MTTAAQSRSRPTEIAGSLIGKWGWASLPSAAVVNQVWDVPNLFWLCWVMVCFGLYRHRERMEDKRQEQADKDRAFKREVLDRKAAEVEKERAFQREMTDKFLAQARKTKQSIAVRLPDGSVFQAGSIATDSRSPVSRKVAA